MPTTTSRQRRARPSSRYVWQRLRRAAADTAQPGWTSARGWASPRLVSGETMVASSASWEPCQRGQTVCDDLDASLVSDRNVEVHVGELDVSCDPGASFAADPHNGVLKGQRACGPFFFVLRQKGAITSLKHAIASHNVPTAAHRPAVTAAFPVAPSPSRAASVCTSRSAPPSARPILHMNLKLPFCTSQFAPQSAPPLLHLILHLPSSPHSAIFLSNTPFCDHPRGPSATRAPAARCSHTQTLRQAGGNRRLAINIGGIRVWQGEQAGSEGPCCNNRQQPRPSPNEGSDGCCTLQREGSACSCSSQQPDEAGSFSTPASANPDAENDQVAPRRPPELRVGAFLASAGICKACAGSGPTAAPRATGCRSRCEWGHQGGVNCELRATPISNDLNAPFFFHTPFSSPVSAAR